MKKAKYIGRLNKNRLGRYKSKIITDEVVLTDERKEDHILISHKKEYQQLFPYLKDIIETPDIIMDDNKNKDTIILLKKIHNIDKYGRIVIKLAVGEDNKHIKNSVITLMRLNERTWKQTLKNRGDIIFEKIYKKLDKSK